MNDEIPIWRIKYLPMNLDQICGREKVKETLNHIIQKQNFPHLLFLGGEGIGKTLIAQLFSIGFLGKNYHANFKLVYANVPLSDEERKEARAQAYVSKSKIGSTAGKKITTPAFIQARIRPFIQLKVLGSAPFKILIVKNFEALGANQQGFRRLMEIYGKNCRMILITANISSIIDPIVSRCQIVLISRVKYKDFKKLIKYIAEQESLEITTQVIEILYKISEGKISQAIDLLQLTATTGKTIDIDKLYENSQKFQNTLIKSLLLISFKGNFPKARELSRKILTNYKFNAHEVFLLLLNELNNLPLSRFTRSKLIDLIADSDFRALSGRDNDIQISALLSKICLFSEYL
ncbi:hypothetical protein LCGC14_1567260 [marine sediment metagenome]|uniref:Replication factor C C-terminal domain-containing protein n=1 Tax=marine sediment metagenome TaxID=412755 RepID=A0A0F9IKP1_9ZZZZ